MPQGLEPGHAAAARVGRADLVVSLGRDLLRLSKIRGVSVATQGDFLRGLR